MQRTIRRTVPIFGLLTAASLAIAGVARAQGIDPAQLAAILAKIDTSQLVSPGPIDVAAFDALARLHPSVAGPLLTGESFQFAWSTPNGVLAQSPSWSYEWRPQRGALLLQVREGMASPLPPVTGGDAGLAQDARQRLESLGIPASEIELNVRRLLPQSTGESDPSDEKIRVRRFDPGRVGATFCDVETSELRYRNPEMVEIDQLRYANHTGAPLPAGLDRNIAASPISMFQPAALPANLLGVWELRCALEDPSSGAVIAEDRASFLAAVELPEAE